MKLVFTRYPLDDIICLFYSGLVLPFLLLNINDTLRILLSLPFLLFIPGYLLLSCLFLQKNLNEGLEPIEKIAFSFGLSLAFLPLIGIILYYTPFGLKLQPILVSIYFIIILCGIIAIYRWYKTPSQKRFIITLNLSLPKSRTKIDRALFILLIITVIITIFIAIFVAFSPKKQERLTEFYILGPTAEATSYPHNITTRQDLNLTIGLINHEHKTMNYTIEIWLINQTFIYNSTTKINETVYQEMWFLDKLSVTLDYLEYNPEQLWKPQWEYFYNFRINKIGRYTLTFLLFTSPTPDYKITENYQYMSQEKIQSSYANLYLWLNIKR